MVHKLDRQFFVEGVSERSKAIAVGDDKDNNNTAVRGSVSECGTVKRTVTTEKITRKTNNLRRSCDHQQSYQHSKNNNNNNSTIGSRRGRGVAAAGTKGLGGGATAGGGSKRRRSSSTDVDDFEKFCTNFNRSGSAIEDGPPPRETLPAPGKGEVLNCERPIRGAGAGTGRDGEVFKRPQRLKRRTTTGSSSSSDETQSIAGLIQNFNNTARLDDSTEKSDCCDFSPQTTRCDRHLNNTNKNIMSNLNQTISVIDSSAIVSKSSHLTTPPGSSSLPATAAAATTPPTAASIPATLKYSSDSTTTGQSLNFYHHNHPTIILGARKFGESKQLHASPKKLLGNNNNTANNGGGSTNAGNISASAVGGGGGGGSATSGNQRGPLPPGGGGGGGNTAAGGAGSGGSSHNFCHTTTTFSLDKNEEFNFLKPPECPVFKPNDEEFKNPLAYISKIRPFAEKYGICKIKPPKTWTPPFTVDVDKLRFTPRVQRLNELEAKTRVKLNFLDQIAKFWELQGSSLKIPMVERKALDLYTLHRIVQDEGGMELATKDRKWSKIAQRMGYPAGKSIGTILKGHYERILHPFDIFTSGKAVDLKLETESDDQDYKPHGIISRQQITPPNETTARRSKRFANSNASCGLGSAIKDEKDIKREEEEEEPPSAPERRGSSDYRKVHCYGGPGHKVPGYSTGRSSSRSRMMMGPSSVINAPPSNSTKKKPKEVDPLAKYICHICNRGDAEEAMLLCDGCDDSYHTFCLIPPLNDIPKGDWRCPKCVVEEVSKPQEAFGFEQASREYTLQQFGEMADQFKADYFNMSVHLVPTELVEREFWRIVSSIDEDVTVEYGADLHTMDHGSGFPTKSSLYLLPGDQEYAESSWNLNNLPLLEESILGHINADISGMKVPWMYVGMCFATFCWHNEDHWSYSINYLHWGEAKTWYGVPGSKAEAFEATMKSAAPELFHSQPDLLHQLVTIMNPNILMNSGVPVYRTDQHAGEFVITFPRAYHAGFNQGYNFAEAVNFAPADWMKMGRECINHYSTLRRFCVFSHDELVCKMALDPDRLNLGIATACYLDMAEMVDSEKKLRKSLLEWGVTQAEREPFELIPDDERQCDSCKTTCFLSAVACSCTQAIVCLRHYTELCECQPEKHTLKYRYTLDELPLMLKKLKVKAESFENWLSKVRDVLDPNTPTTITLEELQELAQEADDKKFPSSVLLERLNSAVLEAEKCVTVIQQLDINKMRTRTRNSNESAKYKLTLDELELFVQEIDNLCCIIQEGQSVRELRSLGKEFVESAKIQLSKPINKADEKALDRLIEEGGSLCIELHEIKALKDRFQQVNWFNRIKQFRQSNDKKSVAEIKALIKEGLTITPDTVLEKQLINLQDIILAVEEWELVAEKCFKSGTQHELPEIELLLERAEEIQGILPSQQALKDALKKAKEWLGIVENLQANETYPYFHTLENVVNRGKNIPFKLEELQRMEDHLNAAKLWKERTSRTFLKKDTSFTLMDVLSPRSDAVMIGSKGKKKSLEDQFTEETGPAQMVNAFKNAEEKELREMRDLRQVNGAKNPQDDKYCVCKRKFQGQMYHCQLCKDWFHDGCVPPPKNTVRPRSSNAATPTGTPFVPQLNVREKDRESKYLCQSCMRSRRPRLETILSLLVSLQRLPIRLPEGEALQCLTERAMNWQDRARQAFATEDVASALAALSIISQKISDGGRSSDKILTEIMRKGKPNRKRRSQTQTSEDDGPATSSDDEEFRSLHIHEDVASGGESSPSSPTKIEHAYSVPPPTASAISNYGKVSSPAHKSDLPLIQLNKTTRETLEDLMMEGDLLEVSLDETLHIWRILNAAKPSMSDLAYIQHRYNIVSSSNDVLVNNVKKRRSDEIGGPQAKRTSKVSTTTLGSGGEKSPTKMKRGRKMKLIATKDTDSSILLGETKKRKRGKKINQQQQQQQEQLLTTGSTSDDDEECSATSCARPSGREVDWVQCDGGCNKWFHMFCVDLDKHSIKPDDDYICKRCKKTSEKEVSRGMVSPTTTPIPTTSSRTPPPPIAAVGGASTTESPILPSSIVTSTSNNGSSNPPSPAGAGQQQQSSPEGGSAGKIQQTTNVLSVSSSTPSPILGDTAPSCSNNNNSSSSRRVVGGATSPAGAGTGPSFETGQSVVSPPPASPLPKSPPPSQTTTSMSSTKS